MAGGKLFRGKPGPCAKCNGTGVFHFGRRVYGVHLKDVKDAKTFTVLGRGDLRTVDLLKALAHNHYDYCLAIEYEENPANPFDEIKDCLAETRRAIAEVKKA